MPYFIFIIFFIVGFIFKTLMLHHASDVQFAAFVRVKDEIKTVIPCLTSIDGLFDKIVIIHSNEPDDGSVEAMNEWCDKRSYCHIYEYPHAVYGSHTANQQKIKYENSLAGYYNFGLEKFEPEEYVVKIDADQIYITPHLKETLNLIRQKDKENDFVLYGIKGYNTYPYKGKLVKYKPSSLNGGSDAFIIKRKYIENFYNSTYYEKLKTATMIRYHIIPFPAHWFHFMKKLKSNGIIRPTDGATSADIEYLSDTEKKEFEQYIRPLLKKSNSPYKNLSL